MNQLRPAAPGAGRRRLALLLVVGLLVAGCSSESSAPTQLSGVDFWTTPDGASLAYDVASAGDVAEGAPVVVLFHGLDGSARASMAQWSETLAGEGMLVVNADWFPSGASVPVPTVEGAVTTPAAVACAIDHARFLAGTYGADSRNLIVVAVSAGAYEAMLAVLTWDRIERGTCLVPGGPPPAIVVSLAGAYDAARRGPLASALADSPEVLAALDPFEHVDNMVASRFVIVHGDADPIIPVSVAQEFANRASDAGTRTDIHVVDGGAHFEFGSPTTTEGAAALAAIVAAAAQR